MADLAEPLTLEEAKKHLRVDGSDDDALIQIYISAAREAVEDHTGCVLQPRETTETARRLGDWIDIDTWPIKDATDISIFYIDGQGAAQQLPMSGWYVGPIVRPIRVRPLQAGWGTSGCVDRPVVLTIQAGWAPDEMPQAFRTAMLLLVGHLYANREEVSVGASAAAIEIPAGIALLLRKWRMERV